MLSPGGEAAASERQWLAPERSAALVQAAQTGSARELDALLHALRPPLFGYFARRVDAASADDLTQRALVIIARRYRGIDPAGASRWLVTVARNIARDEYRRSARAAERRAAEQDARGVPVSHTGDAHIEYVELVSAIVAAARRTCSASLRDVVIGLVRGLDVREIARELGVSEPAVRVRLTRARPLLRRELGGLW